MLLAKDKKGGISTYALYKEKPSSDDPEFFHIEDIKSRARLFSWEIDTHSHPKMFQLVYVRSGNVLARLDNREYHTEGPCLFTIPPSVVHEFKFEKDITLGYVITVSWVMLAEDQIVRCSAMHDQLIHSPQIIDLEDLSEGQMFLDQTIAQLIDEYRRNEPGKQQLLEYLLFSLLIKVGRNVRTEEDLRSNDHYDLRYQRLCNLIEKYYRQHKTCEFYADELCTTTISLNRACKTISGKSVGELIQDRLALEAQRMLIYSSAPISLIAYELGFADPAYFSRFFKRRVGNTPSAFRERRERD